jgi:hypothetical protein
MRRYFRYLLVALFTFALGFTLHSLRRRQDETPASAFRVTVTQKQAATAQARDDTEIERRLFDPRWVYVTRDIRWERVPKEFQMKGKSWDLNGRLIVFYPSGAYAEVSCHLIRDNKTGSVEQVENTELGHSTFIGKWSRQADGTISTVARYDHSGMYNVYLSDAPQVFTRRWVVLRPASDRIGTLIEADGEKFVPASYINELDGLPGLVRDWQKDLDTQ